MGLFSKKDASAELAELDRRLNDAILAGKALEAFEEFYADNVEMQENDAPATVGKAANREREKAFMGAITEFRGAEVLAAGVGENVTFSHWRFDFTHRDWGVRNYRQVAVRTGRAARWSAKCSITAPDGVRPRKEKSPPCW